MTKQAKKSADPLIYESGLPDNIINDIISKDLKSVTHRSRNAQCNLRGPALCYMSQFSSFTDWPQREQEEPTIGTTNAELEQRLAWWASVWTDKNAECPSCQYRKTQGEPGNRCFYFIDPKTIIIFTPGHGDP
jgi:hypothetical protein